MNKVFEKIIEKLEEKQDIFLYEDSDYGEGKYNAFDEAIEIVKQEAEQYEECYKDCGECEAYNKEKHHCPKFCKVIKETVKEIEDNHNGWIPCSERLPECENKYGWVSCIVSVIRSHYPTSTYDICDSPYDENIVMHANYHVSQKIWHLECDEQLNALIDIDNSPLNGDYVIAWQPLPEPYQQKGE